MPHVLIAGKLHPSGIALLDETPGVTYDYVEEVSEPGYASLIGRADGLVIRTQPLSAPTVEKAQNLRIVSRHGVGYDSVDLPALNKRGIALAVVGDVNSVSVAEHAMMLLLAAAKRTLRADRAVRENGWNWRNKLEASELAGKRLLILGYGRIGRHLARMAAGFSMQVAAYDPFLEKLGWPEGPVSSISHLDTALGWADAISVHAPKSNSPLIAAREFRYLKRGAILINTARGGVVDEAALIEALLAGRVAAAGLDVFDSEPPAADDQLLAMDQVILTPHIAGLTVECGERMAISSVKNVLDFFEGKIDPTLVVNGAEINGE
ncbi:hydroxyacid dehydrogenase [Mesorhizobium sp. B3-1-3]|uniref:hydroxyacid dehydrogenase n=1 Tax=unclassified Mesorhizobium TaxID=325217 RepID=UPI0011270C1C|nr:MULTISPECIES: hydroxyacid dehydrogenase [unclassified Mesorhizobium]TPI64821.1 hydroxyacid dehydrogenase [Mesorhizobium sp. B3-1-3]TPI69669.1 hydroxyacid dehydrogenase [Mesorhizobium sp. B3-1-8]